MEHKWNKISQVLIVVEAGDCLGISFIPFFLFLY